MKESSEKLVQLKGIVDSTMKEIEHTTDKEDKIVLYSRAIDALSQIVELSGDVSSKILRGELSAKKELLCVELNKKEELDKDENIEWISEGLREIGNIIEEKEAKNFVNHTKPSDLNLEVLSDSGIDLSEVVEYHVKKCEAKTANWWGRFSYGLFELLEEILEEYDEDIEERYEGIIQDMMFKQMKDAVSSGYMPGFGFEHLANACLMLIDFGSNSIEEKIKILELGEKAMKKHFDEFLQAGGLLRRIRKQLEELKNQ